MVERSIAVLTYCTRVSSLNKINYALGTVISSYLYTSLDFCPRTRIVVGRPTRPPAHTHIHTDTRAFVCVCVGGRVGEGKRRIQNYAVVIMRRSRCPIYYLPPHFLDRAQTVQDGAMNGITSEICIHRSGELTGLCQLDYIVYARVIRDFWSKTTTVPRCIQTGVFRRTVFSSRVL